jgi:hypothetical protein
MKKEAAKKPASNKKTVEAKEKEPRSPWAELATAPAKDSAKKVTGASEKTSAAVSEPGAIATVPASKKQVPKAKAKAVAAKTKRADALIDTALDIAIDKPKVERSPAFKTLAEPKLPELQRENRARLMMQTPTELYFYWSVKENPYHMLRKAFGDAMGSYKLVVKLTETRRGFEEIHPVEADGNWWFHVEPNGDYQAEIGFYAPDRPYFRIIYSNTIETPRRSPSRRAATDADWKVSANKFAEVLDVAGFSQDAFDVAMAGDDHEAADDTTHIAFSRFIGNGHHNLSGIAAEDIRYALMALAAGIKLETLRSRISRRLFEILLQSTEKVSVENATNALVDFFDIEETEFTEHEYGSAVYGASLVNFPRTLKTRRSMPKFSPLSSHIFGTPLP